MTNAVESVPGTDPDRSAFTVALETARDQVIAADGILPGADQPGLPALALAPQAPEAREPTHGNARPT